MSKFEIKATELQGTDVNFVSLVKRGANRIPFRLTKGETDMLDLHSIARKIFKSDAPKPELVAAILAKGVDMVAVANVFKDAGIDPKTFQKGEKGGNITVMKADADLSPGITVFKVSDEIALVYTGVQKAFTGGHGGSDDFNEVNSSGGHHLALMASHDALGDTIQNALKNAKDPDEAKAKIEAACDAHKDHVGKLTGSLPQHAFKMEAALRSIKKACGTGNANGGGATNQETGPGKNEDKALNEQGVVDAKKADGGKNGTGEGFERGDGTETNPKASADDKANTEVDAKPGERVSGSNDGLPAKANAKKADGMDLDKVPKGNTQRNMFRGDADGTGDDDTVMTGFVPGDTDGFAADPKDSKAAAARATANDKQTPDTQGQPGGETLDTSGIHPKALAKNDGDADVGQKGKDKTLPDDQSGAGAQQKDVQTLKGEDILAAIAGLKKSVDGAIAGVAQKVDALAGRVDGLDDKVQKTDAALHGTVFADAPDDQLARTQKSDTYGGDLPLIDTGFARRVA